MSCKNRLRNFESNIVIQRAIILRARVCYTATQSIKEYMEVKSMKLKITKGCPSSAPAPRIVKKDSLSNALGIDLIGGSTVTFATPSKNDDEALVTIKLSSMEADAKQAMGIMYSRSKMVF